MRAELIPRKGPAVPLRRDVTLVGRDHATCDIIIERDSISALHCLLVKTDGLLFVRDLASTNGTTVNGQRISRGALLPNDELTLGDVRFTVKLGPAAANEPTPPEEAQTEWLEALDDDEPEA